MIAARRRRLGARRAVDPRPGDRPCRSRRRRQGHRRRRCATCSACPTAARSAACSARCSRAMRRARWRRSRGNMSSASSRSRCCAALLELVHRVTLRQDRRRRADPALSAEEREAHRGLGGAAVRRAAAPACGSCCSRATTKSQRAAIRSRRREMALLRVIHAADTARSGRAGEAGSRTGRRSRPRARRRAVPPVAGARLRRRRVAFRFDGAGRAARAQWAAALAAQLIHSARVDRAIAPPELVLTGAAACPPISSAS